MLRTKQYERVMIAFSIAFVLVVPATIAAEEAVHFVYKFKPGYSQKFKVEFGQETSFPGGSYVFLSEMKLTETCIEAEGDSVFKMELVVDEISTAMRMNDKLIDNKMDELLLGQTIGYQLDKLGEVTNIKAKSYIEGWSQVYQIFATLIQYPEMPDSTIEIGGQWECTKTKETMKGEERVTETTTMTCEFEEIKKEKGRQCAKIKAKGKSEINGELGAKFEVEYYFDPSEIGIVKFKAKIEAENLTAEMKKELM